MGVILTVVDCRMSNHSIVADATVCTVYLFTLKNIVPVVIVQLDCLLYRSNAIKANVISVVYKSILNVAVASVTIGQLDTLPYYCLLFIVERLCSSLENRGY